MKTIDLTDASDLAVLVSGVSELHTINLEPLLHCGSLCEKVLSYTDNLIEIDFGQLPDLVTIEQGALELSNIRRLTMNNPKLSSIGDKFCCLSYKLRVVNFGYMPNITRIPNMFLATCPHIEHIDMSSFPNVTHIGSTFLLAALFLKTINFKGLTKLKSIDLSFMAGCGHLEYIDLSDSTELADIKPGFCVMCINLHAVQFPMGFHRILEEPASLRHRYIEKTDGSSLYIRTDIDVTE